MANAFMNDVAKARKAGMSAHFSRPVDAVKRLARVKKCFVIPEKTFGQNSQGRR